MTKRNAADVVNGLIAFFKNVPSEQLDDLKQVTDLWNEAGGQFSSPSSAEIKTGSPQASSGGGAERMVAQYSDPAPQMGMTQKYAEFSSMLSSFGKAIDAQGARINAITGVLKAAADAVAAEPAVKTADPDSAFTKAAAKLKKARAELRKADMCDDGDKDEREEKKSFLVEAGVAIKSAKRLLVKAEDEENEDDDAAEKARTDLRTLSKALKKAEDEDEKKDKEDFEKAEAVKAAAEKAIADTATAKAAEEAAVVAAAAKAAEVPDEAAVKAQAEAAATAAAAVKAEPVPVDQSVRDQITLLNTSVKGLMDVVMAGSKGRPMPAFVKGATVADLGAKVDEAIESGVLNDSVEIMKAQTLVSRIRAVQAGHLDAVLVDDEIAKAPTNVRSLFAPAQAAA